MMKALEIKISLCTPFWHGHSAANPIGLVQSHHTPLWSGNLVVLGGETSIEDSDGEGKTCGVCFFSTGWCLVMSKHEQRWPCSSIFHSK